MSESARAFCQRCLRAFFDLAEGQAPSDFHRSIKELVEKSPKCRACYESYVKTSALCRKAMRRSSSSCRRDALRGFLRQRLRDRA